MKTWTKWLMMSLATLALGTACDDKKSGGNPQDTKVGETTVSETTVSDTTVNENDTTAHETTVSETTVSETTVSDTTVNDTTVNDTTVHDTTVSDTTHDTDTTTVSCDFSGLTPAYQQFGGSEGGSSYYGFAEGDGEYVRVAFFPPVDESSPSSPLTGPGDYVIGSNADDMNWRTCTTCVLGARECDPATGDCARWFFAVSGTIHVTELDYDATSIVGTLEDVKMQEVTIDWEGDLTSMPVDNGKGWCVDTYAFSTKPECTTSDDCTTDPNRTVCDDYNTCVECATNDDCTADPNRATCSYGTCVECESSFDCKTAAKPVCGDGACVAAVTGECSGDDSYEENDGPAQAASISLGTEITAGICEGTSGNELDYYLVNTTAVGRLHAGISWAGDGSLSLRIVDSTGASAGTYGNWTNNSDEWIYANAPAGRYYVVVSAYDTMSAGNGTAAMSYNFTVTSTPPECTGNADCKDAARPFCDVDAALCGACVTGLDCTTDKPQCVLDDAGERHVCVASDFCTGDDARENGDDGPKGATVLAIGDTKTDAKMCGDYSADSATEADWYVVTLEAGVSATATLTWQGDSDLDLYFYDATLTELDSSEFSTPETISITGNAAGTYYLVVKSFARNPTDAIPYTLSLTTATP